MKRTADLGATRTTLAIALVTLVIPPCAAEDFFERPITAAGVLERDGRTDCSAVLIGPDLILTAAHCVAGLTVSAEGGENTVRFRTGALSGDPGLERDVVALMPHPLYLATGGHHAASRSADIALALLERPIPAEEVGPIPEGSPIELGETVILASYPGGSGAEARQRRCEAVDADASLARLNCAAVPGESGAPALRITPEGPELAALVVAAGREDEVPYALVVQVSARLGQLFAIYGHSPP